MLSKLTGWGLADILELDTDEFWAWLKSAQGIENEVAKAMRAK